jgi:hypothetical protein
MRKFIITEGATSLIIEAERLEFDDKTGQKIFSFTTGSIVGVASALANVVSCPAPISNLDAIDKLLDK